MANDTDSPPRNEMKSFRLYVPKPAVPLADGSATEYSAEEIEDLQAAFAPAIARRRWMHRILGALLWAFLASLVCFFIFQIGEAAVIIAVLLPTMIVAGWIGFFGFRLKCPGCGCDVELVELGRFCPECGHPDGIEPEGWFRAARCSVCSMNLPYRKGYRAFKIRACTHCGLPVDEEGV